MNERSEMYKVALNVFGRKVKSDSSVDGEIEGACGTERCRRLSNLGRWKSVNAAGRRCQQSRHGYFVKLLVED